MLVRYVQSHQLDPDQPIPTMHGVIKAVPISYQLADRESGINLRPPKEKKVMYLYMLLQDDIASNYMCVCVQTLNVVFFFINISFIFMYIYTSHIRVSYCGFRLEVHLGLRRSQLQGPGKEINLEKKNTIRMFGN